MAAGVLAAPAFARCVCARLALDTVQLRKTNVILARVVLVLTLGTVAEEGVRVVERVVVVTLRRWRGARCKEVALPITHVAGAALRAREAAAMAAIAFVRSVRARLAHNAVQQRKANIILARVVRVLALGALPGQSERPENWVVIVGLAVVSRCRRRRLVVQTS